MTTDIITFDQRRLNNMIPVAVNVQLQCQIILVIFYCTRLFKQFCLSLL